MEQIGVWEAKAHLSNLVKRASHGETIVITRNGLPAAKLTSVEPTQLRSYMTFDEMTSLLQDIRSRAKLCSGAQIKNLITEGRRF